VTSSVVPLRRVFRVVNGGTPSSHPENWGEDIAWATPVDLAQYNGAKISSTQRSLTLTGLASGSNSVPGASLIVSSRAPIGYVAETTRTMAFNQGCKGLVPMQEVDIRYFRYQLSAMEPQLKSRGQGSTFLELSADALASSPIAAPSLSAQRKIADYLDAETTRIDALISKKRYLIELLEERRSNFVNEAVTIGLASNGELVNTRNRYIPRIPKRWRLMRLRHVVEQIVDTPHKTAPVVDDGEHLVVRTSNVKNGRLILDGARYTDRASWLEWNHRVEPRLGDVLLTREAPAGEACIVPADSRLCLGQRMVLLRVRQTIVRGEWVVNSIYSGHVQRFITDLSNTTTVAHLNMSDIPDIPITVPDLKEQQQLLLRIRSEVRRNEEAVSRLNKQIDLLAERRQASITAVVTGEMKVPNTLM